MKLTFIGAAHEVTGSCHYLEACGKHILIDCGLEQGPDLYENQEIPINPSMIDYILLTHAHIDHSGKIPLLVKNGFKGEIICTFATSDLCRSYLHLQQQTSAISCFVTVHISRNPKQNGETGRHFVPVLRFTNHFILYRTP